MSHRKCCRVLHCAVQTDVIVGIYSQFHILAATRVVVVFLLAVKFLVVKGMTKESVIQH